MNKSPTAILCSDIHLREDTPVCRTDDFQAKQWQKLEFIKELQEKHGCFVLCAGDLFHHWKSSPWLLTQAMEFLPDDFYTVYGQHDLPQNNMVLAHKSGVWTLERANKLDILSEANWGQKPENGSLGINDIGLISSKKAKTSGGVEVSKTILVWHKFVWDGKKLPWPGCEENTASEILERYPQFDLIVTGDHHKPFTYSKDGRLLVNPGCMTRQVADYADHKPRVYLWYAETNTVEKVYLPCEEDVVSREHIEIKEKRDKRIDAFVSRLNDDWEVASSFEDNLERFFSNNKVRSNVKDVVYKAIDP